MANCSILITSEEDMISLPNYTILQLEMLLHVYASAEDYEFHGNETRTKQFNKLVFDEMISVGTNQLEIQRITAKGRAYIEMLRATPLPVQDLSWKDPRETL